MSDWLSTRALLSRNVATASRQSTIADYQSSEIAQLKRVLEDTQDSLKKSKLEVQKLEDKVKHVEDHAKRRERRENWLSWKVAVLGVLLPLLIFLLPSFFKGGTLSWSIIEFPVGHGVFLVPLLMLSLDALLRWMRIEDNGRTTLKVFKSSQIISATTNFLLLFLAGASQAGFSDPTRLEAEAVTKITLWGLFIGIIISTLGAIALDQALAEDDN